MRFLNVIVLWLVCITGMQAQISVVPTVKHLTSTSTPTAGAISLEVSGGTSPYSYTWTPGPVYTKDINNKSKSAYVVTVKDNAAATVTYTYNVGYKLEWDQMYGCISRNDSLIGDASRIWAQAVTKNNLSLNNSGFVEYILKGMSETKVFGVLDSLSPLPNTYADIDYGFYYEGPTNTLYEVHYGGLYNATTGYTEGAALRIERSSSTIKFVVNGITTNTVSDASGGSKVWKVKAMLYGDMPGNSFVDMGCSFANKGSATFRNYSNIVPFMVHSAGSGLNDGSIWAKPLITGAYTYTWQPGSVASATITSKPASGYTLNAKDAATNTITSKKFNIGYKVKWDQPYNSHIGHDSLISKNLGIDGWGSAISKNTLAAGTDGWFEYVLRDMDQYKIIGFTDSLSPDVNNIYDIDHGFYYELGTLYAFGGGGFGVLTHNTNEGSVLRVERRGDTIEYRINGALVASGVNTGESLKNWKVKGTVYVGMNSRLVNVGCSFYGEGNSSFPNYTRLVPTITHAGGPSTNDGGVSISPVQSGSYTYVWQPGSTTGASISLKAPGAYPVTVKDVLNHQNTKSYNIGYKVKWDQLHACVLKHDTLVNDLSYNWGRAVSKNTLPGGQDGWMEYVLKNLNQTRVFGFTDSLSPLIEDLNDIDHGFYYDGSNQRLYIYTNNLNVIPVAVYASEGTILRIERKGDTIYYKVNDLTVASGKDSIAVQKTWKIKADVYAGNTSSMINVGCSFYQQGYANFPNYHILKPAIVHASTAGANDGSVKVRTESVEAFTYMWQPGEVYANPLTDIGAGTYQVSVEDTLHHSNSNYYHVGYKTYWDSVYGATVSGDTLKTTEAYTWGRAISKNTLAANTDGWFEYVLEDLDKIKVVGFLDSMSTDPQDIYDIDYGFNYDAVYHILYTFYKGNYGYVGQGVKGSILRVERKADTILFFMNGISLGSIIDTVDARKPWKIKGIVHAWAGTKLVNVGCSFPYDHVLAVHPVVVNYQNDTTRGSVDLHISGGHPPYNIAWNGLKLQDPGNAYQALKSSYPGIVIDSLLFCDYVESQRQISAFDGLYPGTYTVTIYDQSNDSITARVVIGADLENTFFIYGATTNTSTTQPDTLDGMITYYGRGQCIGQNGTYVAGSHVAVNLTGIDFSNDNELSFAVSNHNDLISVGFQEKKEEINGSATDIHQNTAFRFNGDGTFDIMYQSSGIYSATFSSGDRFIIKTNPETQKITYFKNNVQLAEASALVFTHDMGYLTKVAFGNAGAAINSLKLSLPIKNIGLTLNKTRSVTGTVRDVTCANRCGGSINVTGSNALYPYPQQYVLTGAGLSSPVTIGVSAFPFKQQNNVTFTNLCPGTYTVTYYSNDRLFYFTPIPTPPGWTPPPILTGSASHTFEVAYMPDWVNYSPNITVSGTDRSLTKTSGLSQLYTWDAGASSLNILKSTDNGWLEWTASASGAVNGIGLSNTDVDTDINTIDYGIGFIELTNFYIYTDNRRIADAMFNTSNVRGNYGANAVFRLEKNALANTLALKVNNTQVGIFPISSQDLILDASMQFLNGVIKKPRVSFGCIAPDYFAELKKEYDAGFHDAPLNILKFKYTEEYNTDNLDFKVYNFRRQVVLTTPSIVAKKEGINKYSMNFTGLIPAGIYYLEVKNGKGEQMVLKFKLL